MYVAHCQGGAVYIMLHKLCVIGGGSALFWSDAMTIICWMWFLVAEYSILCSYTLKHKITGIAPEIQLIQ